MTPHVLSSSKILDIFLDLWHLEIVLEVSINTSENQPLL